MIPGAEKSCPIDTSILLKLAKHKQTQNQFFTQLVFEQIFVMRANGRLFMTQARLIFLKQR